MRAQGKAKSRMPESLRGCVVPEQSMRKRHGSRRNQNIRGVILKEMRIVGGSVVHVHLKQRFATLNAASGVTEMLVPYFRENRD